MRAVVAILLFAGAGLLSWYLWRCGQGRDPLPRRMAAWAPFGWREPVLLCGLLWGLHRGLPGYLDARARELIGPLGLVLLGAATTLLVALLAVAWQQRLGSRPPPTPAPSLAADVRAGVLAGLALMPLYLPALYFSWGATGPAAVPPLWQATLLATVLAVLVPVAEEYLFRGVLYGGLRSRLPVGPALILSSAAFVLVHPPSTAPVMLVLALAAGYLYERTRALTAPILLHALHNAAVLGYAWLQ